MRGFLRLIAALIIATGAAWIVRPAGVGDPGGLIALADHTFPQLAALRVQYYPWAAKPTAFGDGGATAA